MPKISLPLQLLLILVGAVCFGSLVPLSLVQGAYTVSFLIKEVLEFFLPFVVFFFISSGIMAFQQKSVAMIGILLGVAFTSNYIAALYTYVCGASIVGSLSLGSSHLFHARSAIAPLFSLNLRPCCASEKAMLAALLVGVALSFYKSEMGVAIITRGKRAIEWGLSHLFIPVLPLYVLGFFLKMSREMPLAKLFSVYGVVFVAALCLQVIILFLLYLFAAGGSVRRALSMIGVAVPSYVTALGTMSSIAALPVSIVCAEKNSKSRSVSYFAMPILANIHLMGDAVSVPLFCLATMYVFTASIPSLATYLVFIGYFCFTMLAVSGIPGGGIIVMLPLLKSIFGFTPDMLSLMTALYLLQDGFGTAANVMGDGALVIVLNKIRMKLGLHTHDGEEDE